MIRGIFRTRWGEIGTALFALTAVWWLFTWRYFTPIPADRLMLSPGDFTYHYLTFREILRQGLQAGILPLWTRCLFGGFPFQAYTQSAFFYPGAWLPILSALWTGRSNVSLEFFHFESLFHLWIAAALAYFFLRKETGSPWGALLGATVFGFGGYLTGYPILQVAIVEGSAWLPLFLLGLDELIQGLRPHALLLAVLGGILPILSGQPQIAALVWGMGAIFFFVRGGQNRLPGVKRLKQFGLLALIALGVTAVQLLPAIEFALHSDRARLSLAESGSGFPVHDIVQFLQPGLVSHWHPLYVGLLPLTLAIAGLILRWPRAQVWAVIGGLGLLLSFGANFPLYEIAFQLIPLYPTTRSQERHALWVSFALATLAAHGLAAVLQGIPCPRRPIAFRIQRASGFFLLGVGLALPVVIFLARQGIDPSDHRRLSSEVALSGLAALGAWGWWTARVSGWRSRTGLGGSAFLISALNLAAFNRWLDAAAPGPIYPEHPAIRHMEAEAIRPFRFYDEWRMPDHIGCWFGLEDIDGSTSIRPEPYFRFLKETPEALQWWLLGVRYVVTWGRDLPDMSALGRTAVLLERIPQGHEETRIFRLDPPLPWAWVVREVHPVRSVEEALTALRDPAFQPARQAITLDPIAWSSGEGPAAADEVQLLARTAMESRYRVRLARAGLLITRDPWYPGWEVLVNGQPAPLVRANVVLMAVPLSAGESEVIFRYRPWSFYVGAIISGATLLIAGLAALLAIRRMG
ncbi:MAG: YfhO family protein [Anaerolineae bacterium]|nr:YfhO family protein [Anaerolineae bacterium]